MYTAFRSGGGITIKMYSNGQGKQRPFAIRSAAVERRYAIPFSTSTMVPNESSCCVLSSISSLSAALLCSEANLNRPARSRFMINLTAPWHRWHTPSNNTIDCLLLPLISCSTSILHSRILSLTNIRLPDHPSPAQVGDLAPFPAPAPAFPPSHGTAGQHRFFFQALYTNI
ncbi:hypothetical protein D3C80_1595730 [compost metagenome]